MLPKRVTGTIIAKEELTWKVTSIEIGDLSDADFSFIPGQFISVEVAANTYRAFSICSDYRRPERFRLIVETGHNGPGANFFRDINIGSPVNFIGPAGKFRLKQPISNRLYFFSTGSGIAPFIPMFYQLSDLRYSGDLDVYIGFRTDKEILLKSDLASFYKKITNFNFHIYVTEPSPGVIINKGRISQVIKDCTDLNAQYYLCGNPKMVDDNISLLLQNSINPDSIIYEKYTSAIGE